MVLPEIERHGPIEAWIIDDTGFPKQGRHSVGVARQYCGQLGKQDNCQVAVSLSIANHHASLPVAYRLYLPKDWAEDRKRRRKAGVPEEISFKTKPEIAIEQLRWACAVGLASRRGADGRRLWPRHRSAHGHHRAWAELCGRHPAADVGMGTGHAAAVVGTAKAARRDATDRSRSSNSPSACARSLAHDQVAGGYGRTAVLALCAHARSCCHRDINVSRSRAKEWLLIEWPEGEDEPTKYWLSTLPENIPSAIGRHRQTALAHRARLSGTQTGGRARPL